MSVDRLRALLDADAAADCVVSSRRGMINRLHYAKVLGCTPGSLTRFRPLFSQYEKKLGIGLGLRQHLGEMRDWLASAYEAGNLDIRGGTIGRSAFAAQFGLRGGGPWTRSPELRALFSEFDARAEAEGYLPARRQEELGRIQALLDSGPVLNRDRLTINLVELARMAGVPLRRLRDKRFADAIGAVQADILATAKICKIDPYLYGRVFAFSVLEPSWPRTFLERVGARFRQVASGWSPRSVPTIYPRLLHALNWIGQSQNQFCRAVVAEAATGGSVVSADDWEDALFAYRDHLLQGIATGSASERGVVASIIGLRSALEGLATGHVVPPMSIPLPTFKHAHRRARHINSAAETKVPASEERLSTFVDFARQRFLTECQFIGCDVSSDEAEHFVAGIAAELTAQRDLPANPSTAIRLTLERRLAALKARALVILEEAKRSSARGRELLSLACIDSEGFAADLESDKLGTYQRKRLVRSLFPDPGASSDVETEVGLANLLTLILERHSGIPPLGLNRATANHSLFFQHRYNAYGGVKAINAMLNPDANAVGAALTLYLIESGANVSVGRTLDRDCIEESDLANHRRITGHKARAKGKPIIVDLPEDSPAVRAIEWLKSTGSNLVGRAGDDSDRLFLIRIGARVQLVTAKWYTDWFKSFACSTPGLEALALLPSMIRPSVILHAALSNDGRLAVGLAIGQHGVGVTQGYQQRWPTKLLYDQNIRRFQAALETTVMSNVEDAAARLGITAEQFEARLGNLDATGLGTFCRDRRGRKGDANGSCSELDCWNNCPNLVIVAEVNAIAALQLWQTSLRQVQPEWERDRPERWSEVWLPWLCLTDVVEEKMVRGPMIKIWNSARVRAAEISALAGYVMPRPW